MKRKVDIALICFFLAVLLGFSAAFWILPDKSFSPDENRVLQTLPRIPVTPARFWDGGVSADFSRYCSDQFPLRASFVRLRSLYDLSLGRGESNGVLCGQDGQLAVRLFDAYVSPTERLTDTDGFFAPHVDAGLAALADLKVTLDGQGISLCVLPAPRTVDAAASAFDYPADGSDVLYSRIVDGLAAASVSVADTLPCLRQAYDAGEYVMYRTDHHWTTRGAYLAYAILMDALGRGGDIIPESAFTVESVPDFIGTTASRSGLPVTRPDTLELWAGVGDAAYTTDTGEGDPYAGFVVRAYLDGKDKYGAFLDGTHRVITVTKTGSDPLVPDGAPRPRLLLARDSFASAMIPFLARHFDIVAVNLSGGMTDLSALAAAYTCDTVVVLVNLENFVTSPCIRDIR